LHIALNAPTHCVAAAFLHGRESIIPSMFERLLQGSEIIDRQAPTLGYYLNRHIELDTQGHEPAAQRMLQGLTLSAPEYQQQAVETAINAVENRIKLWDDVRTLLQQVRP
jgi:hypothetical protein